MSWAPALFVRVSATVISASEKMVPSLVRLLDRRSFVVEIVESALLEIFSARKIPFTVISELFITSFALIFPSAEIFALFSMFAVVKRSPVKVV